MTLWGSQVRTLYRAPFESIKFSTDFSLLEFIFRLIFSEVVQTAANSLDKGNLISIRDLRVWFPAKKSFSGKVVSWIRAVDGVSFDIPAGKTIGLVGESGSGKSTIGKAILQLVRPRSGTVNYNGTDLCKLTHSQIKPLRRDLQIIFQDPYNSLNPRLTIFQILSEPLEIHFSKLNHSQRLDRCAELLREVGLQPEHLHRFPHEFSGGQRQRIGIARALAVQPKFIVCDEPVSALDVSVQARIVNLLKDIQQKYHLTYLFIAHDMAVVEHMSDQVIVLNSGKIVEFGDPEQVIHNPQEEYTRTLISSIPTLPV